MDKKNVRFHFVSGSYMDVLYSPEIFELLKKKLGECWPTLSLTGNKWGVNFSLVTHYEVIND